MPYLASPEDLLAVLVTWAIGVVLFLAGAGLTGNRIAPEFQIGAGWGALCLLLTSWGVFVPLNLCFPAAAFGIAALGVPMLPGRRLSVGAWMALGPMLAVSLPLWLIMAPIRRSQPDTFLNLLPNAFYLVDYGRLPSAALPPSFSLLPGAPYDTQFLSFLGSILKADYPASGMSLVNVMLQLVAALAIARALGPSPLSPDTTPAWGIAAVGLLLTTLLNPGLALLLSGDNDSVATMLSGVLADTAPRRQRLDLLRSNTADAATVDEAARLGYRLALISCTPEGWEDLPPSQAVLLHRDPDRWHILAAWPYPADAAARRWQHILSWGPLCRQS